MKVVIIPVSLLREAVCNPNVMDRAMAARLRQSLLKFGLVQNLVVHQKDGGYYEVLSGNQRLRALQAMGTEFVPCVIADVDDARARLLAQALNHIYGEDDLGLKAELVRDILTRLSQDELLRLLPETAASLDALSCMSRQSISEQLKAWEEARKARLRRLTFHLTSDQVSVVEGALGRVCRELDSQRNSGPRARGFALFKLCESYLQGR